MVRLTWWGSIGFCAFLVACGKEDETPAQGATPIEREELAARAAEVRCQALAGCCDHAGVEFDENGCRQLATDAFEFQIGAFIANVEYDAKAAGEFLEALRADPTCGGIVEDDTIAAWQKAFRGKLEPGQACNDPQECRQEPGYWSNCVSTEDGNPPRVCQRFRDGVKRRHSGLGEPCSRTCDVGSLCEVEETPAGSGAPTPGSLDSAACYRADGLWCNLHSEPASCSRVAQIGESCPTDTLSCAVGSVCAFETRKCTAPRAVGEACLKEEDCQSGYCMDRDAWLTPIAPRCVAEQPVEASECRRESGL